MPRVTNLPTLNLKSTRSASQPPHNGPLSARSIDSPQSPRSPPLSPILRSDTPTLAAQLYAGSNGNGPTSPQLDASPEPPSSSGRISPKQQHWRNTSKNPFSNFMASKSSHRLHSPEPSVTDQPPPDRSISKSRGGSKERSVKKQTSTPDLPRLMVANNKQNEEILENGDAKVKGRSKLGGILTRSRSGRPEDEKKVKPKSPVPLILDAQPLQPSSTNDPYAFPLKTAPMKVGGASHLAIGADTSNTARNRSADRAVRDEQRRTPSADPSNLPREASLLSNISHTGRGVGNRIGQASRGLFNKMTRSGSTNERETIPDEQYTCTTINLPLVKQTRKTRIAKNLEESRDKTEYWLPALPWRCIDYLNVQCEQEGLYRVPGSGKDVKLWQRRFDTEYDVNLLEQDDLYDVNTIASLFKAWLRDLPDELLSKSTQRKIAKACEGNSRPQETPQILKDELSKLPPFNYYILFAITCHLSLLHQYSDLNKMDYRNLCICFQPCLKIDAFCFQYLVVNWKECWTQGCWTEKEYLEEEKRYQREGSMDESFKDSRSVAETVSTTMSKSNGHQAQTSTSQLSQTDQGSRLPQTSRGVDSNSVSRASTSKSKQRSQSSSGRDTIRNVNHGHAATAPVLPLMTSSMTGRNETSSKDLPELGGM